MLSLRFFFVFVFFFFSSNNENFTNNEIGHAASQKGRGRVTLNYDFHSLGPISKLDFYWIVSPTGSKNAGFEKNRQFEKNISQCHIHSSFFFFKEISFFFLTIPILLLGPVEYKVCPKHKSR